MAICDRRVNRQDLRGGGSRNPGFTYEEVAGLVLGYDPWDLGLQTHQVSVEPLLDKMGIEYDHSRKFLGKNGKDIGRPGCCTCLK